MKLVNGDPKSFLFEVRVPEDVTGDAWSWDEKHRCHVLTVDRTVPHWGILRSIEQGVYRDGAVANDIINYSVGVKEYQGSLVVQFQLRYHGDLKVREHKYLVQATFNFY